MKLGENTQIQQKNFQKHIALIFFFEHHFTNRISQYRHGPQCRLDMYFIQLIKYKSSNCD